MVAFFAIAMPPLGQSPDEIEVAADAAIARRDGDVRSAPRPALLHNEFLERELDQFRNMVPSGCKR